MLRPRLRLRYPPFRAGERLAPSLSCERRRSIEGDRECRERDGERDRGWSSGESMVAQAARSVGAADCCHGQRARYSCSNGSKQSPARLLNTRRAGRLIGPWRSLAPHPRFWLRLHHSRSWLGSWHSSLDSRPPQNVKLKAGLITTLIFVGEGVGDRIWRECFEQDSTLQFPHLSLTAGAILYFVPMLSGPVT